jgi:pimeloyl-ACP methyl ester carboxylesterase
MAKVWLPGKDSGYLHGFKVITDSMNAASKGTNLKPDQEVRPIPGLKLLGFFIRGLSLVSAGFAARCTLFLFSLPGRRAKHFREDELLKSAQRGWVMSGDKQIRTYTWGNGERRILLLHGWQSRGTALRYFVPILLGEGIQVVAMDAPGHGESSGYRMTITEYAQAILDVEQKVGPFSGAIAHSFGGRAITYAMGYLDHQWQLKKIVLLAVPASITRIFSEFFSKIGASEALIQAAHQLAVNRLGHPVEDSEIYNIGPRLKVKFLVIHDSEDQIVPLWEAQRIVDAIPGAQYITTHGLGHYRLAKAPATWEEVRSFFAT